MQASSQQQPESRCLVARTVGKPVEVAGLGVGGSVVVEQVRQRHQHLPPLSALTAHPPSSDAIESAGRPRHQRGSTLQKTARICTGGVAGIVIGWLTLVWRP